MLPTLDHEPRRCHHAAVAAVTLSVPSETSLPRRFGPYTLVDKIGQGGMAEIYLAHATTSLGGHRRLVIKQILPMLAQSAAFSRLLVNEARLSALLNHMNVVHVYDLGAVGESLYIAMEYVEGVDLRQLLRASAKKGLSFSLDFALYVITEVLAGLDYAHNASDSEGVPLEIVHRDVSPSNILLSLEGEVKLCDFGIARALGVMSAVPNDAIQGKAGYMAPEAALGLGIDARADVFSVGVILWELLSGRRLYRGEKGKAPPLHLAQEANIPELTRIGFEGEDELHAIARRALMKDVEERYASAREMKNDLDSFMLRHRILPSPLHFGRWITEHCAEEVIEPRQMLEQEALYSAVGHSPDTHDGGNSADDTDHSHIGPASSSAAPNSTETVAGHSGLDSVGLDSVGLDGVGLDSVGLADSVDSDEDDSAVGAMAFGHGAPLDLVAREAALVEGDSEREPGDGVAVETATAKADSSNALRAAEDAVAQSHHREIKPSDSEASLTSRLWGSLRSKLGIGGIR